jgi:uncharacterized protein YeaO (DUF488 family)
LQIEALTTAISCAMLLAQRMSILLKRAHKKPSHSDGTRVLVEHVWPRGVGRDNARIHAWLRDLAPSGHLRRWFQDLGAPPELWQSFRRRYLGELAEPAASRALEELYRLAEERANLTLVHAAGDTHHQSAAILKELLDGTHKPPSSAGAAAASAAKGARAKRAPRRR